ncbi:MAG: hypothetical protein K0Q66_1321 [Chitinophagaceae bacterium]|jgi:hypothetical protein|nr:hypothetical protein [Chitinophagaceae bacterium]
MKVYIEPPEIDVDPIQHRLNELPEDHELKPILQNVLTLQQKYLEVVQQTLQYRIMWALRSLEHEINESGGMIMLGADGQLTLKEFSEDLAERIEACIRENMQ